MRHFQLQVWSPDVKADIDVGVAVLDLIKQVELWQKTVPEGPVIVHCKYVQAWSFSLGFVVIVGLDMEWEERVSFVL